MSCADEKPEIDTPLSLDVHLQTQYIMKLLTVANFNQSILGVNFLIAATASLPEVKISTMSCRYTVVRIDPHIYKSWLWHVDHRITDHNTITAHFHHINMGRLFLKKVAAFISTKLPMDIRPQDQISWPKQLTCTMSYRIPSKNLLLP